MLPNFVKGVINIRGFAVPVVHLSHRLGRTAQEHTKTTSVVIVDILSEEGVINVGLLVDAVDEAVSIPVGNIEKAPEFGSRIKPSYLSGVGKVDDKFIMGTSKNCL